MSGFDFYLELNTVEDRKRAFEELRKIVLEELGSGRIPTYHIVRIRRDGTAANHYVTPVSLELLEDGRIVAFHSDFEFLLELLLKLKEVKMVAYIKERPAVVFFMHEDDDPWNDCSFEPVEDEDDFEDWDVL